MSRIVTIVLLLLGTMLASASDVLPYTILDRGEFGAARLSVDVRVSLVEGRLPSEEQLAAISRQIVARERKHDRTFVLFYLPGMRVGEGAFATAHHNPNLEVKMLPFILMQYPQYEHLAK